MPDGGHAGGKGGGSGGAGGSGGGAAGGAQLYWQAVDTNHSGTLNKIWGSSASNIWAVGELGVRRHYDGVSWSAQITTPRAVDLHSVFGLSESDVWAVGRFG